MSSGLLFDIFTNGKMFYSIELHCKIYNQNDKEIFTDLAHLMSNY